MVRAAISPKLYNSARDGSLRVGEDILSLYEIPFNDTAVVDLRDWLDDSGGGRSLQ